MRAIARRTVPASLAELVAMEDIAGRHPRQVGGHDLGDHGFFFLGAADGICQRPQALIRAIEIAQQPIESTVAWTRMVHHAIS